VRLRSESHQGAGLAGGRLWSPRTGTVYVLNNYGSGSDRVAVLNPRTNKIATTIPIKRNVRNPAPVLAVSPVTGDIYVNGTATHSPSQSWVGGAVTAISGRINKTIATIDFPQNSDMSMAVSPVTGKVYAEDGGCARESECTSTVAVISGQTNKIIGAVRLPTPGQQIAADPVTGEIYVLRPQTLTSVDGEVPPSVASVISG
jgi:DNA-binding beta-propeller fold protein YncE